jgi:hypothetical protein
MLVTEGDEQQTLKGAFSMSELKNLLVLTDTASDTHDSLRCSRCYPAYRAITCPEVLKAAAPMEPPESEQGLLCGARHPNRAKEDPKSAGAAKGRRFKNPKKKAQPVIALSSNDSDDDVQVVSEPETRVPEIDVKDLIPPAEGYTPQAGDFDENDMVTWGHHFDLSTVPDETLIRAARAPGAQLVSFVMHCLVQFSQEQIAQMEEEELGKMRARQHSNTAEFRAQERDAKRQKKAEAEARLDAGEDPLTTDTEVDSDYAPSEASSAFSAQTRRHSCKA